MTAPTPEQIKKIFDAYYPAEIRFWQEFSRQVEVRKFQKNELIKDYHSIEKYINILVSGSVGHFILSEGNDICINLYYENNIFSDYLSFLTQKSTLIKTQAMETSVVWSINFTDL